MLGRLAELDRPLADTLWRLLLQPAPTSREELARAANHGLELASQRLQAGLVTRDACVRSWAEGVRLLREVAAGLGIAGADKWYLREDDASDAALSWYDEVLSQRTSMTARGDRGCRR
jgi:hypothetical protein